MLLETEGFEVEVAPDGESARDRLERCPPDLVLSDVVMPRMSGFELCRHIKSREATRSIPVVLLTALDSPQDLLRGLEAGADNFIRKPCEEEYLLSRIRRILANLPHSAPEGAVPLAPEGLRTEFPADKAQIVELLVSMVEDLSRTNEELARTNRQLAESRQQVARYTADLERMVQERTDALARAAKVSTLSELAESVVEDLVAPMQTVVQLATLLGTRPLGEDARSYVEGISRAARLCLELTEDLRTFDREARPRRALLDLNELLEATVRVHASEWRHDPLELRLDLARSLPPLQADPRQIRSVASKLLQNAREAIVGSGRGGEVRVVTRQEGDQAVLRVEDDGPGMAPEVARQAFDPFFSTRPRSTGMGLALVQAIVHKHGGSVRLEPRPGGGTCAVVELPFLAP